MPQTRLEDAQTGPLKNLKKASTCADTPESADNHQKGNIERRGWSVDGSETRAHSDGEEQTTCQMAEES